MGEVELLGAVVVLGRVLLGVEDGVVGLVLDQNVLAVEGQGIAVDVGGDDFVLAGLEVVEVQGRGLAVERALDLGDRLGEVVDAVGARIEPADIGRRDRQGHGPGHQPVEVDADRGDGARVLGSGLALGVVGLVVPGGRRLPGMAGGVLRHALGLRRGAAVGLVGPRLHGGDGVLGQRQGVDAERLEEREVELRVGRHRVFVPVGDEVEVLAVRREGRAEVDAGAVSHLGELGGGDLVEVEIAPATVGGQAEGEPAAVGREHRIVNLGQLVLHHFLGRAAGDRDQPELVRAVAGRDRLAVGREHRAVEIALLEMRQHRLGAALGRADGDLLRAADVGGVGDGAAVRRPGGVVLVDALGAGEVAGGALLGGDAEDVAAGGEQRPLAVGGEGEVHVAGGVGVADLIGDVGDVDAGAGIVVGDVGVDRVQLFAGQVELIELAALLEGDGVRAQRREVDVVVGEVGDLAGLLGVLVIDPDVGAAMHVLVGQVVDLVAVPHRRGVGAGPVGDLGQLPGVEVEGEDLLRQAAVVALPGAEVPEDAVVGDGVAVGAEGGEADGAVDRHGGGQAAGDRDLPHLLDPAVELVFLGQVDDGLRVRGPGDDHVVRAVPPAGSGLGGRVEGEAPRRAAGGRDHPDVGAGVAGLGVGDPAAVGGDAGEHVLAGGAGQPLGGATRLGDGPDVAVGDEDDPVAVGLWEARQGGVGGAGRDGEGGGGGQEGARRQL